MTFVFFFQAEDGIRDVAVTGVQTCALPILSRSMLSLWVSTVAPVEYRSVRQFAVPPRNSCAVLALGLEASILPLRDLNSSTVRSLVQHSAVAALMRLPLASN